MTGGCRCRLGRLLTVGTVVVVLLGVATPQPSYDLLNEKLGELQLQINTSSIGTIEETADTGFPLGELDVFFRFPADSAICIGLGLESASLVSNSLPDPEIVDGVSYEAIQLDLTVTGLRFSCTLPVCFKADSIFDREEECTGTLTATSNAQSASLISVSQKVLSTDFSTKPPELAFDVERSCADRVKVDGLVFTGVAIGQIAGFFDVTNTVLQSLNGEKKDSAIAPISAALCDQLESLTSVINELAVANPFTNETNFGVDPDAILGDAAKEFENQLEVPAEVSLANLGDNGLLNLILPEQDGALVLETDSALVNGLFSFLNFTTNATTVSGESLSPGLGIVDFILGTDIAVSDGAFSRLDVLALAEPFLVEPGQEISEVLTFEVELAGFGSSLLRVLGLQLSATPSGNDLEAYEFALLGNQTIELPAIDLGDLIFNGQFSLELNVATTEFLDQLLAYSISEDFSIQLDWDGFIARVAAFVAVDTNSVGALELGPIFSNSTNCLLSTFFVTPRVTAALVNADAVRIALTDFDDGLLAIVGDLVAALIPVYQGVIPGTLEQLLQTQLVNQEILEPAECPNTVLDETTELPYDFTTGLFASVAELVNEELVTQLLGALFYSGTPLSFLAEPIELVNASIPSSLDDDRRAILTVTAAELDGLSSPDLDQLRLFDADPDSPFFPQGLINELIIGSSANPLELRVSARLDLASSDPSGQVQQNDVVLVLSIDNLDVSLELFAAMSIFSVESTPLNRINFISCWLSKLEPFGGIKRLELLLSNFAIDFECNRCENDFLTSFSERIKAPASVSELARLANDLGERTGTSLVRLFDPELFQRTIDFATFTCETKGSIFSSIFTTEAQGDISTQEDLSTTYALLGVFFATFGVAGAFTCCCSFHRPQALAYRARKAAAVGPESQSLEDVPLFKNPKIPGVVRFFVPFVLLNNFALFLVGHIGVVIKTDVVGTIATEPFVLDDFASLSVVSSTAKLWSGGAYLLAIMLGAFSIVWPYIKLFGVAVCWFAAPKRLSFERRGKVLRLLDQLGKWSLVELYFVAFVLVVLEVNLVAPDSGPYAFLEGAYDLRIVIEPQLNLYTFTVALLLSLAISNVVLLFHERIEDDHLEKQRAVEGLSSFDQIRVSLVEYHFEKASKTGLTYHVAMSHFGSMVLLAILFLSVLLFIVAGFVPVLLISFVGLARQILGIAGDDTQQEISLFSFISDSFSVSDSGRLFFGFVFFMTVLVVPVIQMLGLVVLSRRRFTLPKAIRAFEANAVLSSWSATEVFVLAVAVTVLEIKTVTSFLVAGTCDPVQGIMSNILLPLGLVTAADVEGSCFGMTAEIQAGAFLFLASLALLNVVNLIVVKLFEAYVFNRKLPTHTSEFDGEAAPPDAALPRRVSVLARFNLATVRKTHQVFRVSQSDPLAARRCPVELADRRRRSQAARTGPDATQRSSAWGAAKEHVWGGRVKALALEQEEKERERKRRGSNKSKSGVSPKIATTPKNASAYHSRYKPASKNVRTARVHNKARAEREERERQRRMKRSNVRLASSTARPRDRPQPSPPRTRVWNKRDNTLRVTTLFKKKYDRGDIPMCIGHGAKRRVQWKCDVSTLDYHHYLPLFFEGLRETQEPYTFLAEAGVQDLLDQGGEKILPVVPQLIMPLKMALNTKNRHTICKVLKILQVLVRAAPYVGEALVPFYRQLLPVCNMVLVLDQRANFGDRIDYAQQKRENLVDLVFETLHGLEETGGRDAFINIKYMIPMYESCNI
ncbi:Parkin coregulated gene protein homolog (Hypertension-related protein 1-like protein) (PARK2 coregulated gene protein) [Durusdinium trenchii]|uniref:Parkin coregulated gene protein homolog (Hypertension-related protein 1-like protein) (PARK2 coregulated gene protein) n=1 Tax=Durusdinium trenchii TaxID=1381693 RepID=A0ABP0P9Y0_9DINO